jgi:hypothetical protein
MHHAIVHRTTPLLLAAMLFLSVFPTAGHFHVAGSIHSGIPAVHAEAPAGADRNQAHDPFHCTIHLIAASFASIEQSSPVTFPPPTAGFVVPADHGNRGRLLFSSADVRGPPSIS